MFRQSLGKKLQLQAEGLGACEEGISGLERLNEHELINRYLHFIEFAIDKDWPSNEFIKRNFDKSLLEHNNVYVDSEFERRNARQVVVVQGNSHGVLLYDGYTTADVYVRHDSEVTIDCSRLSKVFINVYGRAKVKVSQRDGAAVYVYKHGDDCVVEGTGDVMQRTYKD